MFTSYNDNFLNRITESYDCALFLAISSPFSSSSACNVSICLYLLLCLTLYLFLIISSFFTVSYILRKSFQSRRLLTTLIQSVIQPIALSSKMCCHPLCVINYFKYVNRIRLLYLIHQ